MSEREIHGEKRLVAASLSEFAHFVEAEAPQNAIFRGHAKSSWHLIPEVHRGGVISAQNADERVKAEEAMLKDFIRRTRSLLPHLPRDDWEWLSLARHYGLPTRLLDWTENAAAALFFAVEYPNGGVDSAVWCSERPNEVDVTKSPFRVDNIYLYDPPHIAPRITAQSACVTVHPTDYIGRKYNWPRTLVQLIVPAQARSKIRATLRAHGIHKASLFPEPAGIAEEIRRSYCCGTDESDLMIMFAYYGANGRFIDVTECLCSRIKNGKLKTHASNNLSGDPCPEAKKELQSGRIDERKASCAFL